jgi:hypothetical protein
MCIQYTKVHYEGCGHVLAIDPKDPKKFVLEAVGSCSTDYRDRECPEFEKPTFSYTTDIYKCPACLERWTDRMEDAWAKLDEEWKHRVSASDWDKVFEYVERLWFRAHHHGSSEDDCYRKAEDCMKPNSKLLRWLEGAAVRESEARFKRGEDLGAVVKLRKQAVPLSKMPAQKDQKDTPEGAKGVDSTGSDVSPSKYWAGDMCDEQYEAMLKAKYLTCPSEKDDEMFGRCVVM